MDISGHMTDVETPKCLQERQVDEYRIQKSKIIVILEYIDEIRKSKRHSGLSWDCNHQVEENFYATHVQPEVLSNLVALCFWSCWDRAIYHIPNIKKKLRLVVLPLVYLLWDFHPKPPPNIHECCGDSLRGWKSLSAEVAGAFLKLRFRGLIQPRYVAFTVVPSRTFPKLLLEGNPQWVVLLQIWPWNCKRWNRRPSNWSRHPANPKMYSPRTHWCGMITECFVHSGWHGFMQMPFVTFVFQVCEATRYVVVATRSGITCLNCRGQLLVFR